MDAPRHAQARPLLRVPDVILRPSRAARAHDFHGRPYVTNCRSLPGSLVVVASDDGSVHLVDKSRGAPTWSYHWNAGRKVTDLCTKGHGWLTAGATGIASLWDGRQASPSSTLSSPHNRPYLSVAAQRGGTSSLVAAGCELAAGDAYIDIWDLRAPNAPLFTYSESHSEDITALAFSPNDSKYLLSGAQDGLIAAYDVSMGSNEDDAVIATGNTGASLARVGWGGAKAGTGKAFIKAGEEELNIDEESMQVDDSKASEERRGIGCAWSVSDMQTVSIWDADKFDEVLAPQDTKQPYSLTPPWETDYVIDACDAAGLGLAGLADGVVLFTGEPEGGAAIVHVASPSSPSATPAAWTLLGLLPKAPEGSGAAGHSDIVRCFDFDPISRTITTGGEDGRLCIWSLDGAELGRDESKGLAAASIALPGAASGSASSQMSGGRDRNSPLGSSSKKRYKPYG